MGSVWHPFTQMKTAPAPLKVRSAEGSRLYLTDGRVLIDAISSWWVITHGHCHPPLMQAIRRQTEQLDQVIFAGFSHEPAERLADQMVALTAPHFQKVFFSDDGSTSVEVALKMAIQAQHQWGQTQRTQFVAFEAAYHGDTVGAMSVGGPGPFTDPYLPMLFSVTRCKQGQTSDDPLERWVGPFEQWMHEHGDQTVAVILEPLVQGAGGMIMWPVAAVRRIVEVARAHGALVIFDEVMTGFGRTGSLFAYQKVGVAPDLLCLSKGLTGGTLPLSLTLATQAIFDAFWHDEKARMFFHGHSFTANPFGCAAAVANLSLLDQ
ncbi:MAG: adenosylmethionine--8-amino-7-oxononanoate transaminase, partial [Acidobacteria bacterium]|nr:adenosylmethionine--8-amino-7-oxononanoate transaminase [Acidobacteriota bacterium]